MIRPIQRITTRNTRMLDIAWPELVIVGAVALVAIGPKDMPKAMYALGRLFGKARRMMHVLRSQIDQLQYEAEMMESLKRRRQNESTPPPKNETEKGPPNDP